MIGNEFSGVAGWVEDAPNPFRTDPLGISPAVAETRSETTAYAPACRTATERRSLP